MVFWVSIVFVVTLMIAVSPAIKDVREISRETTRRVFSGSTNGDRNRSSIAPEIPWRQRTGRYRRDTSSDPVNTETARTRIDNSPIIPTHYDLWLRPEIYSDNPDEFTFRGLVGVYFHATEPLTELRLHCGKLRILSYQLSEELSRGRRNLRITQRANVDNGFLVFDIGDGNSVYPGANYVLSVMYEGEFWDTSHGTFGVFLSGYMDANDTKQIMCATSLQPNLARELFPCIDEPKYKSTFSIRISRPSWMTALANTAKIDEQEGDDGWFTDHFETTILLPTYLVAFTVFKTSDWAPALVDEFHDMVTTLWVPTAHFDKAKEISVMVPGVVHYFQEYFDFQIPLKKMDMIWLEQYTMGGMENPGLIVMSLSYVQNDDSRVVYERGLLVTHEIIHQWIGNLVTPETWENIWLSEGQTSHLSWVGMETLYPNLEISMRDSRWYSYIRAMEYDGENEYSTPVYQGSNIHIDDVFNYYYVYVKGSAITEIIEEVVGKQPFRQFMRTFIKENLYGSTTTESFLMALEAHTEGLIQADTFRPWVYENGFPIVKAKRENKQIILEPRHFTNNTDFEYPPLDDLEMFQAPIPVSLEIRYSDGTRQSIRSVINNNMTFHLSSAELDWYIVNSDHLYYKVFYDDNSWDSITRQLRDDASVFSIEDLQGFLADAQLFNKAKFRDNDYLAEVYELTCNRIPITCI